MKNNIKILSFILSFIFIISCRKESKENVESIEIVENLLTFKQLAQANRSGIIVLQCDLGSKPTTNALPYVSASFNSSETITTPQNIGLLNFGNLKIEAKQNNTYNNIEEIIASNEKKEYLKMLYGKEIKFSVISTNNSLASDSEQIEGNIYIPKIIDGDLVKNNDGSITRETALSWTPDITNNKKLLICIEFDPLDIGNLQFRDRKRKSIKILTEDDGSYHFTGNDFNDIPTNAVVNIYWGRGNFTTVNRPNFSKPIAVLCYSVKNYRNRIL